MAYCSLTDILERIPERVVIQLTDDDRVGVVDQAKVDAAIAQADARIDAYCGSRYQVPFDSVPAIVAEISADLAVYYLYSRKAEKIPEARAERHRAQIDLLKDIAKGVVTLGAAPAPEPKSGVSASFSGNERQFTRGKLKGM